jgi:signal transduction histidine kinase
MNVSEVAHILVAEDSATQAEQLKYLLEGRGHRVTTAANGRKALEIVRQDRPTVVISDVVMPELDGYGFCRAIKADQVLRDIPVILVTSLSSSQDVIKGLECGADFFLRKPYDEKQLLSRIDHVLSNHALREPYSMRPGIEIVLSGQRYFINSDRQQILDLLISTYEEAVRINEELLSANRQLEMRNREVERASKFKDQFLSTMSHELRTPLQIVLAFCEILLEDGSGPLSDPQRKGVDAIERAGQHLLRLTNDILDLSQIEAGRLKLILENTPLGSIVSEVAASLMPLAERKSQTLLYEVGPELVVQADQTRLRQVLTNLIGNAIKFTPEDGSVEVRACRIGDHVRVEVQDSGPGIPAHEVQRIFEAFYRLQRNQEKIEGTGLGLAITHRLVEMHGGRLDVESHPGAGSCFYFTLPCQSPT